MFTEKSDCKGGASEKSIYRGHCLKKGGGQFPDFQGDLAKKRSGVILSKSVDTLMHTMTIQMLFCKIPNPKNMSIEVVTIQ